MMIVIQSSQWMGSGYHQQLLPCVCPLQLVGLTLAQTRGMVSQDVLKTSSRQAMINITRERETIKEDCVSYFSKGLVLAEDKELLHCTSDGLGQQYCGHSLQDDPNKLKMRILVLKGKEMLSVTSLREI